MDTGTTSDMPFPVTVPCAVTADANDRLDLRDHHHGGLGLARQPSARSSARSGRSARVALPDGGADGLAATADNSVFATQGVFVP